MMRSITPSPFRGPFNAHEFVERDTIPCMPPTQLDLVAEGVHVDLSTPEAAGAIAMLTRISDEAE